MPPMCLSNVLGTPATGTPSERIQRQVKFYTVTGNQKVGLEIVLSKSESLTALEHVTNQIQVKLAGMSKYLRSDALLIARELVIFWTQIPASQRNIDSLLAIPSKISNLVGTGKRNALLTLIFQQKLQDYLHLIQKVNSLYDGRATKGLPSLPIAEALDLVLRDTKGAGSNSDLETFLLGLNQANRGAYGKECL